MKEITNLKIERWYYDGNAVFLKDIVWYTEYYDGKGHKHYKLTNKAPKEAMKSYCKYYKTLEYAEKHNINL